MSQSRAPLCFPRSAAAALALGLLVVCCWAGLGATGSSSSGKQWQELGEALNSDLPANRYYRLGLRIDEDDNDNSDELTPYESHSRHSIETPSSLEADWLPLMLHTLNPNSQSFDSLRTLDSALSTLSQQDVADIGDDSERSSKLDAGLIHKVGHFFKQTVPQTVTKTVPNKTKEGFNKVKNVVTKKDKPKPPATAPPPPPPPPPASDATPTTNGDDSPPSSDPSQTTGLDGSTTPET